MAQERSHRLRGDSPDDLAKQISDELRNP